MWSHSLLVNVKKMCGITPFINGVGEKFPYNSTSIIVQKGVNKITFVEGIKFL